jgi:hypothetical protein
VGIEMIEEYKCLFVSFSSQREIKRKVGNKYKFYKSINLVARNLNFEALLDWCELTFHLFQARIHFNLKTDTENELFLQKCGSILIKKPNRFSNNYKKCNGDFKADINELEEYLVDENRLYKILTDFGFYLMIGLILTILIPAFSFVCCHLYSDCKNKDGAFAFENKVQPTDTNLTNRNSLMDDFISDNFEFTDEQNSIELKSKELELSKDSKDLENESSNEGLNQPNIIPANEDLTKSIDSKENQSHFKFSVSLKKNTSDKEDKISIETEFFDDSDV